MGGAASIFPDILTVYRVHGAGRDEPSPRDYLGRQWTGDKWAAYWQDALAPGIRPHGYLDSDNETFRAEYIDWFVEFNRQMMNAYTARGQHCTYFNCSVGSFRPEHMPKLVPLLVQGQAQGHLLALNAYWDETDHDLFWYFKPLVDAYPAAPWILKEVGWTANDAAYQGPQALQALLGQVRRIQHPNFKGAALWCENGSGGGWPQSNIGADWRYVV